ncbi:hypothetical protein [Mongoliitalea daihaiensis]|uniref:hypothetical protein n=1 Tax=Mongoliitalea daihaiensis TaxID=2782006 RepID=UPI001F2DA9C6|nr:hypothetical protein [Mongoliitalea daihaiensis]UJP64987.1 hypothetical protein IPZ59_19780 [Mongoliitalea daihaiensis]
MNAKKVFYILGSLVTALVVWFVYESFNQPGVGQLEGTFEERAFYRNENNTGPVKRVYAVYTSSKDWDALEQYGMYMPHTKYGTTTVYFFDQSELTPKNLNPTIPHFESVYQESCIAVYEKNAMGQASFRIQPFN